MYCALKPSDRCHRPCLLSSILQVAFFLPQLVQLLRSDDNGMIKSFLMASADRSIVFAHHLVCTLRVGSKITLPLH